jgi:mono/diheme cytochrome c family protein
MKKIFNLILVASTGLLLTSCYYDELPAEPIPANVSYAKDVQGIFNKNCIGCHKGTANTDPNLLSGSSYQSLTTANGAGEIFVTPGDASGSILFQAMTGKGAPQMPPNGALSSSKLAIVEKWINDGASNN